MNNDLLAGILGGLTGELPSAMAPPPPDRRAPPILVRAPLAEADVPGSALHRVARLHGPVARSTG